MDITITVYHPTWQNGAVVCELRGKFGTIDAREASGERIMNIGIVEGHCYLINDLEGLCKIWRCAKCGVAFNKASNLKRHKAEVDCSPEPKVVCMGKRVEGILSSSDKVFYGTNSGASLKAVDRESGGPRLGATHSSRLLWSRWGEDRGGKRQEN